MKKSLLFSAALMISCSVFQTAKADHLADRLTFSAHMEAAPGVTTNGHGVAAFMLNSTRDTMYFTTSAASLTSPITGWHIHNTRLGGAIVLDFDGKVYGNTIRSFITGSDLNTLLPDFITGNLYMALHTVNHSGVEIWGTIKPETDWNYDAMLDGTQAGTSSAATGWASINFSMKGDTATVRVVSNLSNAITNAHLHTGKPGQSGGVILPLYSLLRSDSVTLLGGVSINASTWTNIMAALMADSIYLNLHTAAEPAGEIRGQVRTSGSLRFDAWFNQDAEIAAGTNSPVASEGVGVATLDLNPSMDTLRYNVFFKGLVGTPTASHFHRAAANTSGGVVKPLTITGNTISGMWTRNDATAPLHDTMINQLLMGNLYINVHTDSNPAGEIRGQVYRLAREGFIAELNGAQASTSSGGQGSAVASYDRDRTNLHTMVAFDGLDGTVSAGHIHAGAAGENGPVIIGLEPFTNGGSYKFSTAADNFNESTSIFMRRNDSTYINIHTSSVAAGEIRGQLIRYYRISSETADTMSTGVAEAALVQRTLNVYPNPVTSDLQISFEAQLAGDATVRIYDIRGREVFASSISMHAGANNHSFDLSSLHEGMYIAEISSNKATLAHVKLIRN
jgi:hypothetical protein